MGKEVTREEYITFLDSHTHACLSGAEGKGKSTLLKSYAQHLKESNSFIDFARLGMSPDQFSIDYIGSLISSSDRVRHSDIDFLKTLDVKGKEIIAEVAAELEKKKPSNEKLVTLAFSFPQAFGTKVVCIDNFEEILSLNNYKEISNIISLFFQQLPEKVKLTIGKPLSLPIPCKKVENFSLSEAKKISSEEIYQATDGYPAALSFFDKDADRDKYEDALSHEEHPLYQYLFRVVEKKLSDARGASLLKVVLKILSFHSQLPLSELAEKINRSAPVTKSLLERLIEVGLVKREGKTFSIAEKSLHDFLKVYFGGEL